MIYNTEDINDYYHFCYVEFSFLLKLIFTRHLFANKQFVMISDL